MISTGTLLLLGATCALVYFIFLRKPKWKDAPPGPKGYPILGNIPQMDREQHVALSKLAKEYGPIARLDLAGRMNVVISDYKMLKEIYSDTTFSGRMDLHMVDWILDGNVYGLVKSDGPHWEELRRFTLRQLRDFGFGKCSIEELIMTEMEELIERLKAMEGKPITDVKERVMLAVVNSLWSISTGNRFRQDDPTLLKFSTETMAAFDELGQGTAGLAVLFPWITRWFPKLINYHKLVELLHGLQDFLKKPIEEHKRTIADDHNRDFIDVFLKEMEKAANNPDSAFSGQRGDKNLTATLADLYFAGSDTTSSTLAWMVLYLSKYPEIQKKLQKEIELITGNTRATSLSDRPNMPYTEAVIAEIMRMNPIAATGVAHRAIEDKMFHGYLIPKDSMVTSNIFYIHRDPKIWGDPENFRPERFLDSEEKIFKKHEALIPFSVGRRQCLGETLARDTLFLFTTNLFQRFSAEFDKNGPDHGFEPQMSVLYVPKAYNVFLKDRLE